MNLPSKPLLPASGWDEVQDCRHPWGAGVTGRRRQIWAIVTGRRAWKP